MFYAIRRDLTGVDVAFDSTNGAAQTVGHRAAIEGSAYVLDCGTIDVVGA